MYIPDKNVWQHHMKIINSVLAVVGVVAMILLCSNAGALTSMEQKLRRQQDIVRMYETRYMAVPDAYYRIEGYTGQSRSYDPHQSSFFLARGVVFDGPENNVRNNGSLQEIEVPKSEPRNDGFFTVVQVDGKYKAIFFDNEAEMTQYQLHKR